MVPALLSRADPRLLTLGALLAFAANSVASRLALGSGAIDPHAFTVVRTLSATLVLGLMARATRPPRQGEARSRWAAAVCLALYLVSFSLAYRRIDAGAGALLLFGAVWLTMAGVGLVRGERPPLTRWLAGVGAIAGLGYLLWPASMTLDPMGAALMLIAGIGWGGCCALGTVGGDAVATLAAGFSRALLLVVPIALASSPSFVVTARGLALALCSGAVISGLGYAVWFSALRTLSASAAALAQLAVPVLAALGGIVVLREPFDSRLLIASIWVLGSVLLGTLRPGLVAASTPRA